MNRPSWIGYTLGGRYVIEALLGQGGMSAVYRANDPNLRRPVAIKLIHSHLSSDPEFVRRFEAEAAAVAQLRHPNIVQVFDFNHDDDVYYMVMEYLPGESLQDRLRTLSAANQRFSLTAAANIIATLADAVAYAHERGTIHRDLKPANVMLMPQGQPVLTDFGVAKIIGGQRHTATGAVIGTPAYMAPEQVRGQPLDGRADIYSLGVMLYELLAGRPPFEGDSAMTVMLKHINDPVPNIRQWVPDIPDGFVAIIDRAMAKQPSQRFQSAGQLATALRTMAQNPAAKVVLPAIGAEPSPTIFARPDAQATGALPSVTNVVEPPRAIRPSDANATEIMPPSEPPPQAPPKGPASTPWALLAGAAVILVLCLGFLAAGVVILSKLNLTGAPIASVTPARQPTVVATGGLPTAATTEPPAAATLTLPAVVTPPPDNTTAATLPATAAPSVAPSATQPPSPTARPVPAGMVLVPAGTFNMGKGSSGDTSPVHPVTLDAFFIDKNDVVNRDYQLCVTAGACTNPMATSSNTHANYYGDPAFGSFPMVNVTWDQAVAFCKFQQKSLPTEAQWEYAATGGDGRAYPWGNNFDPKLLPTASGDLVQVGSFPGGASPFGVNDMAGNALQWVADWYQADYYASSPPNNPAGPASGTKKVLRGGAYGNPDPTVYLSSRRFQQPPTRFDVDIGFRCVMPAK